MTSLNAPSHRPEILTGPFGSEAMRLYSTSTADLFKGSERSKISSILGAFRAAGATVGVTPTYGASKRGLAADPQLDAEHERWNRQAALLSQSVFAGLPLFGSIATILNSSGEDDGSWSGLSHKASWAKMRHLPQLLLLRESGVDRFLLEAGRYVDEAIGFVQAAVRVGAQEVICSLEAPGGCVPDPAYSDLTFEQLLELLSDTSQGKVAVGVGVNCIGAEVAVRAVESQRESTFSAVYPNSAAIADDATSRRFLELAGRARSGPEEREFQCMREALETSQKAWAELCKTAVNARVRMIGVCCGSTPEDVVNLKKLLSQA